MTDGDAARKKGGFPAPITILLAVLLLVWAAAFFIPAGQYQLDAIGAKPPMISLLPSTARIFLRSMPGLACSGLLIQSVMFAKSCLAVAALGGKLGARRQQTLLQRAAARALEIDPVRSAGPSASTASRNELLSAVGSAGAAPSPATSASSAGTTVVIGPA